MKKAWNIKGTIPQLRIVLSLVLMVLYFASCKGQSGLTNFSPGTQPAGPVAPAPAGTVLQSSYADVVSRVSPAVVTVRSTERIRAAQQFPFMDDPSLRDFFGDR